MKMIVVSLLSFLILGLLIATYIILQLFRGQQVQETFLRAKLIKQMEAIQQAERKSMNKSLAFASASHDIRNSLAGITGLIECCRAGVIPNSEFEQNLAQMNICALKLLGILNSVLDTSKVEAGKMQLEEVEFDMAQVLEESIDIFHVVALRKGLEVIWDPCDCSVLISSNVKGDCKRFKQILDNLLGNAIKFTSKGHVVVRAWAKKPTPKNCDLSPHNRLHSVGFFSNLFRCFAKDDALETHSSIQYDDSIEFIFEVDDSGMGISKEKRTSVFENYVQVRESSPEGHEGTGLGLGIVQSFVRLMGGEISIKDKEPGEKGTCFRFNIFAKANETSSNGVEAEGINSNDHMHVRNPSIAHVKDVSTYATMPSNIQAMTFRKGIKMKDIHSLFLINGDETRKVVRRWLIDIGIKVWEIHHHDLLPHTLEQIKHNLSGSEKFEYLSPNISSNKQALQSSNTKNEAFPSSESEVDQTLPLTIMDGLKKASSRGLPVYLLVIIDLSCGNITEICSTINNFAKGINDLRCKVVWLADPNTNVGHLRSNIEAPCDLLLQKPFHGSRLCAILHLLQEFGGENDSQSFALRIGDTPQDAQKMSDPTSSAVVGKVLSNSSSIQSRNISHENSVVKEDDDKPLSGMTILLVEDVYILRRIAVAILSRLGATVESYENGLEAVNIVKKALREANYVQDRIKSQEEYFPYNVILMDCEMPVMNGYEATRCIREEEKHYGIHIPIIALTGHATPEEKMKTILSGMDFHLVKPVERNTVLEAIHTVCQSV